MKFINYLETISGVSIFPMISLGMFFLFFVALLIWALTVSNTHITEMKNIPLDARNENDSPFI